MNISGLNNKLNAPGDFAQAYVIAHEVGHHVQLNFLFYPLKRGGLKPSFLVSYQENLRGVKHSK